MTFHKCSIPAPPIPDGERCSGAVRLRGVERDTFFSVERGRVARRLAAVAGCSAPTLTALVEGEAGDYERGGRVGPPPTGECVK
jgi:hypothetical protein